eukprot:scaffold40932_cov68-Phaeocystis_antarctica.AAC.1
MPHRTNRVEEIQCPPLRRLQHSSSPATPALSSTCSPTRQEGIKNSRAAINDVCSRLDGPPLPPSRRNRLPGRLDPLAHQRRVGPALLRRASRALQG